MSDPYNTQNYANQPYTKEGWQQLAGLVDRNKVVSYEKRPVLKKIKGGNYKVVFFKDNFDRDFALERIGSNLQFVELDSGGATVVFEVDHKKFSGVMRELDRISKGV